MVDLHLHLDGSLTREELVILAMMSGESVEEAKKARISVDSSCKSLNEYLECFEYPLRVLQTKECIEKAIYMLIGRLSRDGLLYAEIRFAPQLHTKKGLSQREVVLAALNGLEKAKNDYLFPAQLILCTMRGEDNLKENLLTVDVAKEFLKKGVCALDLAGAEGLYETSLFEPIFQKANELDVPFTIHAGEADGPKSIWSAVKMGAKRIGHGVRAIEDPLLMSFLSMSGIALELCPTSETDTKAIADISALPIEEFLRKGIRVTLNTDDMTVSNITLKEEYEKIAKTFHFSDEIMKKLCINTIESAFLDGDQKDFLKEQFEKTYGRREKN